MIGLEQNFPVCDAGFNLIGSETRVCQSSSLGWSGDVPFCQRTQVGFDPIFYNVSESDGVAVLVIRRFTPSSLPVTVLFSTQDGTATAPGDYDAQTSTVVTIEPDEDSNNVTVVIASDGATEGPERLFGRLQAQSEDRVDVIQENATIDILDDDGIDISIVDTSQVAFEGIDPSVQICASVMSGSLERTAIVSFFTISASATSTAPIDFDGTTLELTFDPGSTQNCVTVTIVNDDILETAEAFRASLTTTDSAVTLSTDTAQVTIIEDFSDRVTVGFEQTVYTTTERTDPSVELCANLTSGTLERTVNVLLSTSDGTATFTAPSDYSMIAVEFTFDPDNNQRCATVTVSDDGILEATESFIVSLTTSAPVTLDPGTTLVEIREDPDDGILIGFEMASFTTTEGTDPSVEICAVVVNGTLERDAIVIFSTTNDTATAPSDYDATTVELTYGPNDTRLCAIVIINNDDTVELTENFFATLTTSDSAVSLGTDVAQIELLEDPNDFVDCGSLPNPANGMVAMTDSTFRSTANYSCIGGYELVGNIQRTCQANGQWSGSEPTCNCPIDCQNGGVIDSLCTECNCTAGYEGSVCETDIDECIVSDPCQNGATCVNNDGSFTCNCTAGFEGNLCEIDIDECTVNNPCRNGATCVNNDASFTCNCTAGFEGILCETDVDECTVSNLCHNGATCVNSDGSFTCNCTAGFEGNLCETDIDECTVSDPCQNGATCVNNDGSFTCNCTAGFEGNLCETDVDECTVSDPCLNEATCVNNDGSFTCNCTAGFEGNLCETDIDECTVNDPCQNGATCVNNDGSFTCNCTAGFEGNLCNINIDECTVNDLCQNGATCVNNEGSFTCNCTAGFEGNVCETDIDECTVSDPCQNGATCINNEGSFTCNCTTGFEGNICDTDIDECTANELCQNGATCINNDGSFTCNCTAGFEGNFCKTDIDECIVSDPCRNGATCANNDGSFTCNCTTGFEGNLCNTDIDECIVNDPCLNEATCVNNDGSFTCNCTAGFEGNLCETDIDECTVNDPCQNGATCVNNDGSFTCNCTAGFEGNLCETDIDECTLNNPCQNEATCANSGGSFVCNCTSRYEGQLCNIDIDECATNNPCMNGICSNTDGGFQCACEAGFTGELCDENIDDCDPNPCQNGGSCTDGLSTFTCMCAQNWNGTTCEVCDIDNCRECDGAPGVCIDCEEGYMVEQDICVCGLENCRTCEDVPARCTECNLDYVFDVNSMCVMDCGTLASPLNGAIILNTTTAGSTASYSCIGGYTLDGSAQRVCQADGQWSSREPTCICLLNCQNGGTRDALCTECSCAPDYSGDICQDCTLENCVGCTGIPAVCTACETGYAVNNGLCDCTLDNCRTCEGTPPVCRQCADGYTINQADAALCDCTLENCLDCEGSPPSCQQCPIDFLLVGGGCVPREQCGVEFCLVCSEDPSVCEECEEGYRLDDPTNCIVIEDEGGDGLDDAAIIGIAVGCILTTVLLLAIITCIIAGVYRHYHPATVYKKKPRRKHRRPSFSKILDRGGEVVRNPFFMGSPLAESIYDMESLDVLQEEEWQVEKEEGEAEKKDGRGEGEEETKDESGEGDEKEGEGEQDDCDEEFPTEEAGQAEKITDSLIN